jgi:surface antigen
MHTNSTWKLSRANLEKVKNKSKEKSKRGHHNYYRQQCAHYVFAVIMKYGGDPDFGIIIDHDYANNA